jgi:hypothetical protein
MRVVAPQSSTSDADEPESTETVARHRVRLPRFIVSEPTGAGTVVKRMTSAAGVSGCEPCARRAARLDNWLRFEPRR